MDSRRGTTLAELAVVLAIIGLLGALTLPRLSRAVDRAETSGAATSLTATLAFARNAAVVNARTVGVRFDTVGAVVTTTAGLDTVQHSALGAGHGVTLSVTRDSIAYGPLGIGYGAANSTLFVRRGAAAETVWVSRLGRVRRR